MSSFNNSGLGLRRCFICDSDILKPEYNGHLDDHTEDLKRLKFSNNLADSCKTACKICGQIFKLEVMRGHTKKDHGLVIKEYKN